MHCMQSACTTWDSAKQMHVKHAFACFTCKVHALACKCMQESDVSHLTAISTWAFCSSQSCVSVCDACSTMLYFLTYIQRPLVNKRTLVHCMELPVNVLYIALLTGNTLLYTDALWRVEIRFPFLQISTCCWKVSRVFRFAKCKTEKTAVP